MKYNDDTKVVNVNLVQSSVHMESKGEVSQYMKGTITLDIDFELEYDFPYSLIQDKKKQMNFIKERAIRQLIEQLNK